MTAPVHQSWFPRYRIWVIVATMVLIVCAVVWYGRPRPMLSATDPPEHTYQKIIEAYGGAAALDLWRTGRLEYEVEFDFPKVGQFQCRFREAFQLPGKMRREMQLTFLGKTDTGVMIADGQSFWVDREGQTTKAEENPYKETRCMEVVQGFHPAYLLAQGRRITVRGAVDRDDTGRDLVLEIPSEGRGPIDCRVDTRTGLIREYTGPIRVPLRPDPVIVRYEYSEYKNTPGGPVPFRMIGYQEGHKVIDLRITSVDLDSPVEPGLFNPPNRP